MMNDDNYKERICPICGKRFIAAPLHRYKLDSVGGNKLVCSWGCLCKYRNKMKSSPQGRAKTVVKIGADGKIIATYETISQAAEAHGVKPPTMSSYCWRGQKMKDGSYYKIIEKEY